MKPTFSLQILDETSYISNCVKIRPAGEYGSMRADILKDRHDEGDSRFFRNFAKAPENYWHV